MGKVIPAPLGCISTQSRRHHQAAGQQQAAVLRAVGRCSRLAYLMPAARPFVAAMWGALAAAQHAHEQGDQESPPWPPLGHVVSERLQQIALATAVQIELDTSLWGGGAVLRRNGVLQGHRGQGLEILGDNTAALHLHLKAGTP